VGVNCPELNRRSTADAGSRFKKLTFAFINYAVEDENQSLVLDTGSRERNDSFGRILGDVFRVFADADGYELSRESLSEFLLKSGAPVYIGYPASSAIMQKYGR
tara:strand:- start:11 stop:322 length:312 start_codon:yes stop_codon:yes gene_type:complete